MARISRRGKMHSKTRPENITQLRSEHEALDARLRTLDQQIYLTAQERTERKRIQKHKLVLKDRMYALQRNGRIMVR